MTPSQFRKIALSFPDTVESEHAQHPDFRVCGKVFASLGAPNEEWGMVMLTPEQQQTLSRGGDDSFQACTGAWGRKGYTNVRLSSAKASVVRTAMQLAFENATTSAPRNAAQATQPRSSSRRYPAALDTASSAKSGVVHPLPVDILKYNENCDSSDEEICNALAAEICLALTGAECKIWHAHPVWFLDGNPIVGYSKEKLGIRLMFWSGTDFAEAELNVLGKKFKDASIFYNTASEIHKSALRRWLKKAKVIQWDYKNIVRRKGELERIE